MSLTLSIQRNLPFLKGVVFWRVASGERIHHSQKDDLGLAGR